MSTNISDVVTRQETMATNISDVATRQETMATNISDVATRQETMATDISDVATRQETMATNISDVATRQETMATDISDVATRQETMATNISDVATRQETMATNISDVATRQETMATDISDVATRQETMATNISDVATRQETIARDIHTIREIDPKIAAMIGRTHAMITEEIKNSFIVTKGFRDAQEKLQKNRVVIIKGSTGDGKTSIAIQLLHWLEEEQQGRQSIQIYNMEDFDLLTPNAKFITFVDIIFGEKVVRERDVGELNKRIKSVIPSLCGDEQTEANYLIITVRNEVYNSLNKCSFGTVFTDLNIIDLSSTKYKVKEEKMELLKLYKPENIKFSWTKKEKEEIVIFAPNVGFPQCCRLFRDILELQKERVTFFKKPFYFLNEALSKLGECPALLFLFLNDGMISVKDLEPNSEKVNKTLLEEAFEIDLIDSDVDRTSLKYKNKVEFVKKSLHTLSGFLVVKGKHFRDDVGSGEMRFDDVYRFYHDSINVTVALLYGEKTPIGYIRNCPSKSLSYITTSKTSPNMIVISSDHYTDMCERLLREFVCEKNAYSTSIGSLDVWNDRVFVERFVRLLNDRKVDKLAVLNKACSYGAEECPLYLLCEGVKPDEDTPLWSLITGGRYGNKGDVDLLRKVVIYLNDEMKVAVLNGACESGSKECALYLLSEGVKLEKETPWWSLITGGRYGNKGDVDLLRKVVIYLNDEMKVAVLNGACESGSKECALYLLSDGVKPNKNTPFCVVEGGCAYLLRELLKNCNVLHWACVWQSEEMVTMLCDTYPHLVHETGWLGLTPLHFLAEIGNCFMFRTVEETVLKSLYELKMNNTSVRQ